MIHPLRLILPALIGLAAATSHPAAGQPAIEFQQGDRIAYIGNVLADRKQHDGWLETLLQTRLPDHQLVVRNLGFSGDRVADRPRHQGYPSVEFYLDHIDADVIFAFFGYNESFDGEGGVNRFKNQLAEMVDKYREMKPNGAGEPRIVLFTPIAHENLGDPNLPDGRANNERLALYAAAVREVAEDKGTAFVELFESTLALYESSDGPLTMNGVHLNTEGNRKVAEIIAGQLFGEAVEAGAQLEPVRQAVLDKNWHWFNRYRAADGNDIWGSRADLAFVDGQTNREVLEHELVMLDAMTANRDRRVWSLANGRDIEVDDSNVPDPVPVISNVGGGSPSSNEQKEGSIEYLSAEETRDQLNVIDGFEVGVFADESRFPELVNPTQMQVDAKGRLWVAAWQTYPKWEPMKEMGDKLLIVHDDNGDGRADRVTTFAEIHNPLGFEFWGGGVIVTSQPDVWFLKDTTGDDVADVRFPILHGIDSADTHHAANNLVLGPDGGIYWQSGIFMRHNMEHPWGPSLNTGSSGMYRFDPRRFTISYIADNSPNPHGTSFDRWGYLYASDGTGGRCFQVRPHENGFRMHELFERQVRPVAANAIVSSSHFPDDMQGDFLVLNTIGYLGIKHYKLDRDPETGHVSGTHASDFLFSDDRNFRPTHATFGADGALYVSDWHNAIIGHMQHNIRDPNRDKKHGRIFRITHRERPLQEPVEIAGAAVADLLANLEHPVDGVRHRTRVELSARPTGQVMEALGTWITGLDHTDPDHAQPLLEALWLCQQHNVRNTELLNLVTASPEPHARHAAAMVRHHWFNVDHTRGGEEMQQIDPLEQDDLPSGVIAVTDEHVDVRIGTIIERMSYNITEFEVPAGRTVRLTFHNPDFLPHNIIFTQPGTADEVGLQAIELGAEGFELAFIPDNDNIIAASRMLAHGEEQLLEFEAPAEPGEYDFVCTFPGHHVLMRGVMKVVE